MSRFARLIISTAVLTLAATRLFSPRASRHSTSTTSVTLSTRRKRTSSTSTCPTTPAMYRSWCSSMVAHFEPERSPPATTSPSASSRRASASSRPTTVSLLPSCIRLISQDAAAATAWVINNIVRYGGDPENVYVSGHSAGAYLAALLVLDPTHLRTHHITPASLRGSIPISAFLYVEETAADGQRTSGVLTPMIGSPHRSRLTLEGEAACF